MSMKRKLCYVLGFQAAMIKGQLTNHAPTTPASYINQISQVFASADIDNLFDYTTARLLTGVDAHSDYLTIDLGTETQVRSILVLLFSPVYDLDTQCSQHLGCAEPFSDISACNGECTNL